MKLMRILELGGKFVTNSQRCQIEDREVPFDEKDEGDLMSFHMKNSELSHDNTKRFIYVLNG